MQNRRCIICAFVFSIFAIVGTIIMAIVFPTYYQSLFNFSRKYSSIIERANNALTNTGVV